MLAIARFTALLATALLATALLPTALLATACSDGSEEVSVGPPIAADAVTLAALPDGGFLWANIEGTVHDESGAIVGAVAADTDGQRGLLGLAVAPSGRIFVSYTDATFELVVSELVPAASGDATERQIWRGPVTVQGGNGGRMIFDEGELIIGIGLLNDRDAQADPSSVVGKLIAIDPERSSEEQTPRILSGPWFNPFAFDRSPTGELWVADNEPRDGDERVARGDQGIDPDIALVLPADSAPSGLAATGDSLFVCAYNDLQLHRLDVDGDAVTFAETVADDCLLDVELLVDGDIIYSTGSAIVRFTP